MSTKKSICASFCREEFSRTFFQLGPRAANGWPITRGGTLSNAIETELSWRRLRVLGRCLSTVHAVGHQWAVADLITELSGGDPTRADRSGHVHYRGLGVEPVDVHGFDADPG